MIKRMFISLTLLGLAAFAMGGAAMAYFSDSESNAVAITTGTADLLFEFQQDCTGGWVDASTINEDLTWGAVDGGIVPGDTTSDCVRVTNQGPTTLDVSLRFSDFDGNTQLMGPALEFAVLDDSGGTIQGPVRPDSSAFVNGVDLGSLDESDVLEFEVEGGFPYTNSDQNDLQGKSYSFLSTIEGIQPDPAA